MNNLTRYDLIEEAQASLSNGTTWQAWKDRLEKENLTGVEASALNL
jgi:hypothetical protein